MSKSNRRFADNLKRVMDDKKINVAQTARITRLSRVQIYNYLNGEQLPRIDCFVSICRVLKVKFEALTEGL